MDGACEQPMPPTMRAMSAVPLDCGPGTAGTCLQEGVDRFPPHLRAHFEQALSSRTGNLDQQVNVAAGRNQPGPVAPLYQSHLVFGEAVLFHVAACVVSESGAVCR